MWAFVPIVIVKQTLGCSTCSREGLFDLKAARKGARPAAAPVAPPLRRVLLLKDQWELLYAFTHSFFLVCFPFNVRAATPRRARTTEGESTSRVEGCVSLLKTRGLLCREGARCFRSSTYDHRGRWSSWALWELVSGAFNPFRPFRRNVESVSLSEYTPVPAVGYI